MIGHEMLDIEVPQLNLVVRESVKRID
jgi:LacI family transcriptional regulator